jgi:hypothetical protein
MFLNSSLRGTKKVHLLCDIAERAGIRLFFTSHAFLIRPDRPWGPLRVLKRLKCEFGSSHLCSAEVKNEWA